MVDKKYWAPLILVTGNVFYTISFSLVKYFSLTIPLQGIMLVRFMAGPIYLIPYFLILRKKFHVQSYGIFALRIIFGVTGMTCLFLSFKYGQIGKSMLIFECATIWTLLYGYFMHKQRPHRHSLRMIPVAFLGIFLVTQPSIHTGLELGDAFALVGSILNAGVYITLKQLRSNHDTATIVLATYCCSTFLMVVPNMMSPVSLTTNMVIGLCMMASVGFIGQMCMTLGFKYASAGISSLFMLSIIPLTTLSGIIIFDETYNVGVWFGLACIIGALGVISKWQ